MFKAIARWILRDELNAPGRKSFFYPLEKGEESFEKWTRIKELTSSPELLFILRYLWDETETQEQEVGSNNAHRFWYFQGFKACLASFRDLSESAKKKMYFFAGAREKKEAQEAPVSHSYQ
jgi:hypothetical protein